MAISDVHVRSASVFKLRIARKYLKIVQHTVRLAVGFDDGVHFQDGRMEQSGYFCGGHPQTYRYATALSSMRLRRHNSFMAPLFRWKNPRKFLISFTSYLTLISSMMIMSFHEKSSFKMKIF